MPNIVPLPEQGSLLLKYEFACRALAEAASVDEVKAIHDYAAAMQAYARQAKDEQLMKNAMRIRYRAQHRLCQMIEAQANTVGLAKGGAHQHATNRGNRPPNSPATLAEAGIDKNLAKRARRWKGLSDEEAEERIEKMLNQGRTSEGA